MVKLYSIYTHKGSILNNQRTSWFTNLLSIFSENKKRSLYDILNTKNKITRITKGQLCCRDKRLASLPDVSNDKQGRWSNTVTILARSTVKNKHDYKH